MSKDACTPDNAIGKLLGVADSGGIKANETGVEQLDKFGQQVYHDTRHQGASEVLASAKPELAGKVKAHVEETTGILDPRRLHSIQGGLTAGFRPNQLFPETITTPILDAIDQHSVTYGHGQNMSAYRQKIKEVIASVQSEVDNLSPAMKGEAEHWFKDLKQGYPFASHGSNPIKTGLRNIVANTIDMSGTILAGNIPELLIKLPTTHGFSGALKGLRRALELTDGNLWGRIPDLDARGLYGEARMNHDMDISDKGFDDMFAKFGNGYGRLMQGILDITDRPLRNISYAAGEVKGGVSAGLQSVEEIAFLNRLGNDSRLGRDPLGRNSLTFLNYTLSTYNMVGSHFVGLLGKNSTVATRVNSARALGTYTAMTTVIGGGTAAVLVPEPLSELLKHASPDYADWEAENITPLSKLVRMGGITSIGVSIQMANRTAKRFQSSMNKAAEAVGDGDIERATVEVGDAGLSLTSVIRNPFGNPRVQKALRKARDLNEGKIDQDEFSKEVFEGFFPFAKSDKKKPSY